MAVVKQKPVETTYRVLDIPNIVDGDTLWVVRERVVGRMHGMRMQARRQVGESEGMALWAVPDVVNGVGMLQVSRDYAGGRKIRLHDGLRGLNTPEESVNKLGWNSARLDLIRLIQDWAFLGATLELQTYGLDKYGRLMGDLVPTNDVASRESAVFHMIDRGWEAYS